MLDIITRTAKYQNYYRLSISLSPLRAYPLTASLVRSPVDLALSLRRGSRAVIVRLNGGSLSSVLDPFLFVLLALLAALPLLSLLELTMSSISRYRLDVVLLRSTRSCTGAVFVLAGGLGDGLSPRCSGGSVLCRSVGEDLELSPLLSCEDVEPVRSRGTGDALEPVGLTAS